ncbi:hypothetical protein FPRO04_12469 [Fusarium proliferatum]|nr:hypothetical protein FPRO04_12469 [Fusarium proliferatum]
MADAGGGKSGRSSYDGVPQEASFGPQSHATAISSGNAAKQRRAEAKKFRDEQARKEAEEEAEKKAKEAKEAK